MQINQQPRIINISLIAWFLLVWLSVILFLLLPQKILHPKVGNDFYFYWVIRIYINNTAVLLIFLFLNIIKKHNIIYILLLMNVTRWAFSFKSMIDLDRNVVLSPLMGLIFILYSFLEIYSYVNIAFSPASLRDLLKSFGFLLIAALVEGTVIWVRGI